MARVQPSKTDTAATPETGSEGTKGMSPNYVSRREVGAGRWQDKESEGDETTETSRAARRAHAGPRKVSDLQHPGRAGLLSVQRVCAPQRRDSESP